MQPSEDDDWDLEEELQADDFVIRRGLIKTPFNAREGFTPEIGKTILAHYAEVKKIETDDLNPGAHQSIYRRMVGWAPLAFPKIKDPILMDFIRAVCGTRYDPKGENKLVYKGVAELAVHERMTEEDIRRWIDYQHFFRLWRSRLGPLDWTTLEHYRVCLIRLAWYGLRPRNLPVYLNLLKKGALKITVSRKTGAILPLYANPYADKILVALANVPQLRYLTLSQLGILIQATDYAARSRIQPSGQFGSYSSGTIAGQLTYWEAQEKSVAEALKFTRLGSLRKLRLAIKGWKVDVRFPKGVAIRVGAFPQWKQHLAVDAMKNEVLKRSFRHGNYHYQWTPEDEAIFWAALQKRLQELSPFDAFVAAIHNEGARHFSKAWLPIFSGLIQHLYGRSLDPWSRSVLFVATNHSIKQAMEADRDYAGVDDEDQVPIREKLGQILGLKAQTFEEICRHPLYKALIKLPEASYSRRIDVIFSCGAVSLSNIFGDKWPQWLDRIAITTVKGLGDEEANALTEKTFGLSLEDCTRGDRQEIHDLIHFLPLDNPRRLKGLGQKLLALRKLDNGDLSRCQILAGQWTSLPPEIQKGSLNEIFHHIRTTKYAGAADLRFADIASEVGVPVSNYKNLETRWLESVGLPDFIPAHLRWEYQGYTGRFLARNDPRGIFLGSYTNCCQHPGGAGAESAWAGQEVSTSGFYVVENAKGEIVAQSWCWTTPESFTFDSIESKGLSPLQAAIVGKIYWLTSRDYLRKRYQHLYYGHTYGVIEVIQTVSALMLEENPAATQDHALMDQENVSGNFLPEIYGSYTDSRNRLRISADRTLPLQSSQVLMTYSRMIRIGGEASLENLRPILRAVYPPELDILPDERTGLVLLVGRKSTPPGLAAPTGDYVTISDLQGYATWDSENREVTDVAVMPGARSSSLDLMRGVLRYLCYRGGEWSADCRSTTSLPILRAVAKKRSSPLQVVEEYVSSTYRDPTTGEIEEMVRVKIQCATGKA